MTGLDNPCCAQICILFAFTKAIDLKIHLSLRCGLTTSRQKHFTARISLPATHQGSVKVSSKTKHLSCLELTPQKQPTFHENIRQFKSRLHERGYPDTLVNKVLSEVKFEERKVGTPTKRKDAPQKFYPLSHNTTQRCLI